MTLTPRLPDHPGHGHDHAVGLGDTFDFLNTLELEAGSLVDQLETPQQAVRWIADHELLHAASAEAVLAAYGRDERTASRDLARVRRVRRALREVADAVVEGRAARATAIGEVNRVLRSRPVPRLDPTPTGVHVCHDHGGDPLDDALALLAGPLVNEIATGRPERLRVCANDRCRWVFFDASPTGRRRWCDMSSCGNRAKAARHRARVRAASSAPRRATARVTRSR